MSKGCKQPIYIPHFNIGNPAGWYAAPSSKAWVVTAPISRIVPTQAWLVPEVVDQYACKTRMTDSAGQLPFGVRFAGSPTIYLIDGHHRWYSCLLRGRQRFRLLVDTYTVTYAQAMVKAYKESQVPTPAINKSKDISVPVGGFQQMQFPMFA